MEEKKFYEKVWFAWVMMFLLTPVGIFLMFKYKHHNSVLRIVASVFFGIAFIVGIMSSNSDRDLEADEKLEQATAEKEEKPKEEKEKSNEKVDKEAKEEKKEKPKVDEKKIYVEKVKPEIDRAIENYDFIWSELWEGATVDLSNGDQLGAYKKLESAKEEYRKLFTQIGDIGVPKDLSKEKQDLIKEFKNEMDLAAMKREDAAKKAMDMVDTMDSSPSVITDIEKDIEASNAYLMKALLPITTIEAEFDIER